MTYYLNGKKGLALNIPTYQDIAAMPHDHRSVAPLSWIPTHVKKPKFTPYQMDSTATVNELKEVKPYVDNKDVHPQKDTTSPSVG